MNTVTGKNIFSKLKDTEVAFPNTNCISKTLIYEHKVYYIWFPMWLHIPSYVIIDYIKDGTEENVQKLEFSNYKKSVTTFYIQLIFYIQ